MSTGRGWTKALVYSERKFVSHPITRSLFIDNVINLFISTGNLTSVKRIQKINFNMTKNVLLQLNQVCIMALSYCIISVDTRNIKKSQPMLYLYMYTSLKENLYRLVIIQYNVLFFYKKIQTHYSFTTIAGSYKCLFITGATTIPATRI